MKVLIEALLDFFYTPFRKIVNRQTFRYVVCGGGNTLLDIFLYFISYHFVLHKQIVHTPIISISPYIAAFLISFVITFPTGFLLMSKIVFPGSYLKGRVQLFRYFLLVIGCIILNYVFIKLFVESFHIYPTIAKILATGFVISFSYLTQRNYTFQAEKRRNGT
ncbi:MAG: GtrA family protein [Chitinophagaceae bacterium]|nr:GtrA family protein [Chitinophagaceae bacterium]